MINLQYTAEERSKIEQHRLECEAKHWIRENKGIGYKITERLEILEQKRGAPQDALRDKINELIPQYERAVIKAKDEANRQREAAFKRARGLAA